MLCEGTGQLLNVHQEAAIAVDVDDSLARMRRLSAESGRQAEAHSAESAAGQPMAWHIEIKILRCPHLMLADAGTDNAVIELTTLLKDLPQPLDGVLGQNGIIAIGVAQRLCLTPMLNLANPLGKTPLRASAC